MSSTTAGALRNDGAGWSRAVSALDRGAAFVDLNEEAGRPRSISSSKSSRSRCTLAKRSSRFFNLWTSGYFLSWTLVMIVLPELENEFHLLIFVEFRIGIDQFRQIDHI